jgi:hypothetical protein
VRWDGRRTTINIFLDGRPEESHSVEGNLTLQEAMAWLVTTNRLEGKSYE